MFTKAELKRRIDQRDIQVNSASKWRVLALYLVQHCTTLKDRESADFCKFIIDREANGIREINDKMETIS